MDVRLPGVCMLAYCSFCMYVLTHNSVCINVLCLYLSGVEGMQRLSESLKETADTEEKVRTILYFDLTDTCSLKKIASSLPFPSSQVQALSEVHGKVVSLLGELQTRHDLQELQKLRETTTTCEAKCEEMEGELGEARFDLQKALSRCDQLEVQLGDALEELRQRPTVVGPHGEEKGESKTGGGSPRADDKGSEDKSTVSTEEVSPHCTGSHSLSLTLSTHTFPHTSHTPPSHMSHTHFPHSPHTLPTYTPHTPHTPLTQVDQLRNEALEARALAESRLAEVGQLSQQLQEAKKALELARLERSNIPEAAVKETPAYKTLQLQYSVAYQGEGCE